MVNVVIVQGITNLFVWATKPARVNHVGTLWDKEINFQIAPDRDQLRRC